MNTYALMNDQHPLVLQTVLNVLQNLKSGLQQLKTEICLMTSKEQQLDSLVKQEQKKQLSSEEEENRDEVISRSQFRKPIKNPFSDQSDGTDSDRETFNNNNGSPFMQKPPLPSKTALQQAQQQMKWDKTEQLQTQILTKLQGQGMKDKKIKQLALKYKTLNIAYQRQKTQRKNLENQLNSLMKAPEELNKSSVSKKQKKSLQKTSTLGSTCSNCQQNEKKIMDFRLKNQNLKSQLNKATRVITRELGQDFNIDQVLSEQNGWKGRQQKIQKLKGRVKQLQDKLNSNGINVSHMSGFTAAQVTNSAFNGTRTSALMAENKRKQFDNLKVQVQALKSENQILQGKVKSLVSRKIILENQIKEIKADYEKKRQLLIQKSNNDDKFIELLKNQNQRLKKEEKVVTKVIYKDENAEVTQLKKQIQTLKKKLRASESQKVTGKQDKSQEKQAPRANKDLNSVGQASQPPRVVSAEKKKRMQQQYLKSGKYLKKMSSQDEEQLYKNWKSGLNKQSN